MCKHVGLGGQALLHEIFAQAPSLVHIAWHVEIHLAKDSGSYFSFGGGVRFILHMAR